MIADQVDDAAAITSTAAGEHICESREKFIGSKLEPLEEELNTAYERFEQAHEHENELEQAVEEATAPDEVPPIYYKVAIAALILLLLIITALWLGVI